jgi:hypothetical protein
LMSRHLLRLWTLEQRRGRYGMKIRSTEIDRGFLKSPSYGRFRMPRSSR